MVAAAEWVVAIVAPAEWVVAMIAPDTCVLTCNLAAYCLSEWGKAGTVVVRMPFQYRGYRIRVGHLLLQGPVGLVSVS